MADEGSKRTPPVAVTDPAGDQGSSSIGRALSLLTAASMIAPVAGLVVAPVLAHAFDPTRRGLLAAATAPATLMLSIATLGLPEALTYFVAKVRWRTRGLLLWAMILIAGFALLCVGLTALFVPALSKGDPHLARLIMLAVVIIVPALFVNLLRGAATGLHAWKTVALERVVLPVLRLVVFGGLFLTGNLTLLSAVIVSVFLPTVAGFVYVRLLFNSTHSSTNSSTNSSTHSSTHSSAPIADEAVTRLGFLQYGLRIWTGSIAGILLARVDQLLMTPLSSARDLGFYAVAVTISELPLVLGGAVQSALFGFNSRERNAEKLAQAGRLLFLLAFMGCLVVAVTLPAWIGPVFGNEYRPAVWPTILLLCSSLLIIPADSAGTALNAWNRPGLRSMGLVVTLVVNLSLLVLLVPRLGIYGACIAALVGSAVFAGMTLTFASRATGLSMAKFFVPRPGDVAVAYRSSLQVLRRIPLLRRSAGG